MIGARFLRRDQWTPKLYELGCRPLPGKGRLNTAEWWQMENGYPFTVPIEADGTCDFWAFQKLREQLGCSPFDSPIGPCQH